MSILTMDELFARHTTTARTHDGWSVTCNRRLWTVYSPTYGEATREAMHYFHQYLLDGEYTAEDMK